MCVLADVDRHRYGRRAWLKTRRLAPSASTTSSWLRPARSIPISAIRNGWRSRQRPAQSSRTRAPSVPSCSPRSNVPTAPQIRPNSDRLMTVIVVGRSGRPASKWQALSPSSRAMRLARDFRHIDPRRARILLVEAAPRLPRELPAICSPIMRKCRADQARCHRDVRPTGARTSTADGTIVVRSA